MPRILAALSLLLFLLPGARGADPSPFVLQRLKEIEPYRAEEGAESRSRDSLAGSNAWVKMDLLQNSEWRPVPAKAGADVSGEVPAPFRDDSSWAKVKVRYSRGEDEGDPFLRIEVRDVIKDWMQMRCDLPPVDKAYHFRLRVKARAEEGVPVTIGLRQVDRPWNFVWTRQLLLDPSWKESSFDFVLGPISEKLALYVISNDANTIDFNRLSLEAGEAAAPDRTEKEAPRNLLRASRFPLGLPPGANLDRDAEEGADIVVRADPSAPGPDGVASLLVKSGPASKSPDPRVIGQPFAVDDYQSPYTASLDVKGTGRLALRLVENGTMVAARSFPLDGASWQRIGLTYDKFKPDTPYQLEIAPQGAFWTSAWQVAAGTATGYLSAGRPEIALAAVPASRVYLEGEPARIRYQITGKTDGLRLRAKVVDLYGRQRFFDEVPLDAGSLAGEIAFDAFPDRPFGAFRVEAWLVDREGKTASDAFDLPVLRVRSPRHLDGDAPDSPFGVHTTSGRRYLEMAKRIGVNWVRLHDADMNYVGWYFLEPQPGQWHFQDEGIRRYRDQHLMLLAELGTAPAWATNLKTIGAHNGYWDRYYQPNNLDDYARYVRTVVGRYRNDIAAWDVWNEPWNHAWWAVGYDDAKKGQAAYQTSPEPQKDFVALSRAAYQAAKEADPRAVVLGMNSTVAGPGTPKERSDGTSWTRGFVQAGGLDFADILSYHDYTSGACLFPGDAVEAGLAIALGPIAKAEGKIPKPVWATEGSPVSGLSGAGFYHQTLPFPLPENVDATSDKLCRYVLSHLANGVGKVFLYSMHAHNYLTVDTRALILASDDGSPHPSSAAFANMAYWIEDRPFSRTIALKPGVLAYLFEGNGQATAVFAGKPGSREPVVAPAVAGVSYYDLYGNPLAPGASSNTLFYGISTGIPAAEWERALQETSR